MKSRLPRVYDDNDNDSRCADNDFPPGTRIGIVAGRKLQVAIVTGTGYADHLICVSINGTAGASRMQGPQAFLLIQRYSIDENWIVTL